MRPYYSQFEAIYILDTIEPVIFRFIRRVCPTVQVSTSRAKRCDTEQAIILGKSQDMPLNGRPESVRILSLDGGGIKGYTSLLILKRIFRTMKAEGQLSEVPKPCDVFDLIVGTSTGGLIAVMLGRLHMTIDECIAAYEQLGRDVFGRGPPGGKLGKVIKSLSSSAFYDIDILQEQVRKILEAKKVPRDAAFREPDTPACKV